MRSWVGPANWPPISLMCPPPIERFSVRPPTRSRASSTTTLRSAATRARAAASPESPAPTTHTSARRVRLARRRAPGWPEGEERRAGGPGPDELAASESVVHGGRA